MTSTFSPTEDTPFIVTRGMAGLAPGEGDCIGAACCLATMIGGRVMFGSLLVYCKDLLHNPPRWYWNRAWPFHAWCVDKDGRVRDPSAANIEPWAEQTSCELACPVSQTRAVVHPFPSAPGFPHIDVEAANKLLHGYLQCPMTTEPVSTDYQMAYLPGIIFGWPSGDGYIGAELKPNELAVWQQTAAVVAKRGGIPPEAVEGVMLKLNKFVADLDAKGVDLRSSPHRKGNRAQRRAAAKAARRSA